MGDRTGVLSRRGFVAGAAAVTLPQRVRARAASPSEPIIDIHQHVPYSGRPAEALVAHQSALGVTKTVLLPAGRPVNEPATHNGKSNGLAAAVGTNEDARALASRHPGVFFLGANEVPTLPDAVAVIERQLKHGARVIGELKFGLECDGPEMQRIFALAEARRVPVLMHFQHGMYNFGIDRFAAVLTRWRRVSFIGHAQTFWANVDAAYADPTNLYPKGPIKPGGLTDRLLREHPNFYGDLSAGSGLNALTRDEAHARAFLDRHQDKLLFGSDCSDSDPGGPTCQGAQILATLRRLAPTPRIRHKLLHDNAHRLLRI